MLSCCCGTTSRYDVRFFFCSLNSNCKRGFSFFREKKNVTTIKNTQLHSKVRIQTGQSTLGVFGTGLNIVKKEGIFALWKGLLPPVVASTPMYALCFFGYGMGKKLFCDKDAFDEGNFKLGQIGMAGAFSAVFTTPVMAPQERLKCVLQTQKVGADGKLPSMSQVAKGLYKEGGLSNLLRGSGVTVLRDASASFMYFTTYEVMKYVVFERVSLSLSTIRLEYYARTQVQNETVLLKR